MVIFPCDLVSINENQSPNCLNNLFWRVCIVDDWMIVLSFVNELLTSEEKNNLRNIVVVISLIVVKFPRISVPL